MGTCKDCAECHSKIANLSPPLTAWGVGSSFNNKKNRILFVGKNARGYEDDEIQTPIEVFDDCRCLWKTKRAWAYWGYTAEIARSLFVDDSFENIAFTNIIKCNNSHNLDTTSILVKTNCIKKLKVLSNEIKIIRPTHIVFYTARDYDDYIPAVFDSFDVICNDIKPIGKKKVPWLEAKATISNIKVNVLRTGHPERKKKKDFVNAICKWVNE